MERGIIMGFGIQPIYREHMYKRCRECAHFSAGIPKGSGKGWGECGNDTVTSRIGYDWGDDKGVHELFCCLWWTEREKL